MKRPTGLAILITLVGFLAGLMIYILHTFNIPLFYAVSLGVIAFYACTYALLDVQLYRRLKIILKKIVPDEPTNRLEDPLSKLEESVQSIERLRNKEIKVLKDRELFRREFVGNVSHELKTPIFNVQGYLLTLLDGALEEPNLAEKYLKRANKSTERIISIIKDLDFITKLESGVLDIKRKPFDIYELSRDVLEQMEDIAKANDVTLKIKHNIDPPLIVNGEYKRIEQVLINLIQNAIKYAKKPDAYVEINLIDQEKLVHVAVTDNGLGIPKKDLPRIFERFYRVDKSRTRDAGGSGLGLAIVKHIIEGHKQKIHATSTEGVGTSVTFTLEKK